MTVFLTGASGYIGRHVAQELLSRGHYVVGLARKESERTRLLPSVDWCFGDLASTDSYAERLFQSDAVVHCAMDYTDRGENSILDRSFVDTMSTFTGHFVYTGNLFARLSSESKGESVIEESFIAESVVEDSEQWRFQLEAVALRRKEATAVIRLGFVYGGQGGYFWEFLSPGTLSGLLDDNIPKATWPMVHVGDVASLYATVLESSNCGVFHGFDGAKNNAKDIINLVRSVYSTHEISRSTVSDYINQLLNISIATTNTRALSTGWHPKCSSFRTSVEMAFNESLGQFH